ncbi:MAG: HAMP domain-containing protein [Chitinophagaceae bacterium]|nr:MAG: HAMP domain-containing protein [Chitinophagaceae bacterium]
MAAPYTPIQRKLMRVIMGTCGLMLVLTFASLFAFEYVSYRNISRRELQELAEVVAANTASSLAFDVPEDAAQVLGSLSKQKNLQAAWLYKANGTIFAGHGLKDGLPATDPGIRLFRFNGRNLECFEPVTEHGRRLGTLYLRTDLSVMYNRLTLYAAFALLTTGLAALLAFLFSRRLQRSISRPILDLAATASTVSEQKNYSVRATHQGNDEVGQLTHAFNGMLAQIERQNAEINQLNQNLEQKVDERTGQLRQSNRTLQEQRDFIDKIINASIDLIAVFDNQLRYLVVNDTACRNFGRARSEMLGRSMRDVFPNLADARVEQLLQRALLGELIQDDSYQSQVSDRVLQNFYIPLSNDAGQVDRVLLIGHDITEVMRSQRQLQALNADLEKSNRDLEQFAYIASHDLQEPLRKIQTFADLSSRNIQHPQILERYLEKIGSSAARMSNLIRDVLNFSRLSRTGSDTWEPVDLNAILDGIRTDLELLIEEKAAVITAGKLPVVMGNPLQLGQLFQNLLTNALKFTERQPRISITSTTIEAPAPNPGVHLKPGIGYAELRFADNGIGLEAEYADKIFAVFQRLHTSSQYAGTGIGLALCKKIVENHDGAIAVESLLGAGTTFLVYLPLTPVAAPPGASPAQGKQNAG